MMSQKITLHVKKKDEGLRVDMFLKEQGGDFIFTRTQAQKIIQSKQVKQNGKLISKPSVHVVEGDVFEITLLQKTEDTTLIPWDLPLDILYEDDHLLVVNKPSGIPTHPSLGHADKTLVNALIHHSKKLSTVNEANRPGIVHRLDLQTSGLMVVAKTDEAHFKIAEQFHAKSIKRRYYALVYGQVRPLQNVITSYFHRDPRNRKKFASIKDESKQKWGKKAVTHYKVIRGFAHNISLLECRLETGRTHQIRIHLSEKGHGILGDPLYGRARSISNQNIKKEIQNLNRMALWAFALTFIHPFTEKEISFQIKAPKNLMKLLEILETGLL